MNAVKMGWGDVYEFWYVAWFSHYSYQLEAYIALLHTNMALASASIPYRKGKPNRLYVGIGSAYVIDVKYSAAAVETPMGCDVGFSF